MKSTTSLLTSVLSAAIFLSATSAHASTVFDLNISNGCCGPGPYGTVMLTQNGTSEVDFSVSLLDPNQFIFGGHDGAFAFNLNLNPANVVITVSPASISAGFSNIVAGGIPQNEHMDGFGDFNYAIQGDSAHKGGSNLIGQLLTFTVVNSAGALSISDFEVNSTGGSIASFFAADISNNPVGGVSSTGVVGTEGGGIVQSTTPEPATLLIAGVGLLGIGLLGRKRTSN